MSRWGGRRASRPPDEGHEVPGAKVVRATGQAILVKAPGLGAGDPFGAEDPAEEEWIPLSQLHGRSEVRALGDEGLLVITTWLAEKKGLI